MVRLERCVLYSTLTLFLILWIPCLLTSKLLEKNHSNLFYISFSYALDTNITKNPLINNNTIPKEQPPTFSIIFGTNLVDNPNPITCSSNQNQNMFKIKINQLYIFKYNTSIICNASAQNNTLKTWYGIDSVSVNNKNALIKVDKIN
jgi:hypothetical protein